MFRAMPSPIIRKHVTVFTASVMSTDVALCWCHGHQPAATSVDITRSCKYSHMLLMMGQDIARNT